METPQIISEEIPRADDEPTKRKRQLIKVRRRRQFSPPISKDMMKKDGNLKKIIPSGEDDLYALSITKVQSNYLNDYARKYGLDAPDGSEAVKMTFEPTMPQFMMKAVLKFGERIEEGRLVEAVMVPWYDVIDLLIRDPKAAYEISPYRWEEIVAGIYSAAGFDSVVLTPRSGDYGRDVIAEKQGTGSIRIIEQVKAYAPNHLVTADEVRSLAGVLQLDGASKGFLTTTSDFAPMIRLDPLLQPWIPSRLQLIDGDHLIKRLMELRPTKPADGSIIISK